MLTSVEVILKIVGFISSPFSKLLTKWINKSFWNKFFYEFNQVNEKVEQYDLSHLENSKYLNDKVLKEYYKDAYTPITIKDTNKNIKTLLLPYQEIVNFIKVPQTTITISNPQAVKEFNLREDIQEATGGIEKAFIKEGRASHNDPHPRIASFTQTGENKYSCIIEKATYYQQVRTNLSLDYAIKIAGRDWPTNMRTIDHQNPSNLTDLDKSCLSNVVGVSAIWMMGDLGQEKVFLLSRRKKVGVFESKLGIPSGNVEMPKDSRFASDSLIEFLSLDIAREFAEETGLCGKNIDRNKFPAPALLNYSVKEWFKNLGPLLSEWFRKGRKFEWSEFYKNHPAAPLEIENMEIIPLAFVRELMRGGKPQMFFLIRTPKVSLWKIRRSFRKSTGSKEFNSKFITSATLSSETLCNYLYAQKWYQKNNDVDYIAL